MSGKCCKCKLMCFFKEDKEKQNLFGYPCDICSRVHCQNCMGSQAQEVRVIPSPTRTLFYLCSDCFMIIKKIPKQIKHFETEIDKFKTDIDSRLRSVPQCSNASNSIEELIARIAKLEAELNRLKDVSVTPPSISPPEKAAVETAEVQNMGQFELATKIESTLESVVDTIAVKLDSIVEAIKLTNKELVTSMHLVPNVGIIDSAVGNGNVNKQSNLIQSNDVAHAVNIALVNTMEQGRSSPDDTGTQNLIAPKKNQGVRSKVIQGTQSVKKPNCQHQKITPNITNIAIKGTDDSLEGLTAAEEYQWYYVNNLSKDTSTNCITEYLKHKSIEVLLCEKLERNNQLTSSFKIAIKPQQVESFCDSSIWPVNVTVKPFIFNNRYKLHGYRRNAATDKQNFYQRRRKQYQN